MTKLKIAALALTVAAVSMVASPRPASACGSGGSWTVLIGAVAVGGVGNVGFSMYDVGKASIGSKPSKFMAGFQTLWTLPQAALGTYAMVEMGEAPGPLVAWTVWTGALSAYGIYHLATDEPSEAPVPGGRIGDAEFVFSPTVVTTGEDPTPALGVVGRF